MGKTIIETALSILQTMVQSMVISVNIHLSTNLIKLNKICLVPPCKNSDLGETYCVY